MFLCIVWYVSSTRDGICREVDLSSALCLFNFCKPNNQFLDLQYQCAYPNNRANRIVGEKCLLSKPADLGFKRRSGMYFVCRIAHQSIVVQQFQFDDNPFFDILWSGGGLNCVGPDSCWDGWSVEAFEKSPIQTNSTLEQGPTFCNRSLPWCGFRPSFLPSFLQTRVLSLTSK